MKPNFAAHKLTHLYFKYANIPEERLGLCNKGVFSENWLMSSIPSLNLLIRIYEFYYPEVRYLEVAYSGGEGCVQMLPTIDKSITATLDHGGQYEPP